jgi:hypothetical protein
MCISRDVVFVENRPFFYNSFTSSSYSPLQTTSLLSFPSNNDNVLSPHLPDPLLSISPPETSSPQALSDRLPITRVYTRRPTNPPLVLSPLASPDTPVFYDTNNSDELQVAQRYNLRDRTTIAPPDRYRYPCSAAVIVEPTTYQEAAGIHEWQLAMIEELAALDHTDTWDIVPLPSHVVPITCKWVFKVKTKYR